MRAPIDPSAARSPPIALRPSSTAFGTSIVPSTTSTATGNRARCAEQHLDVAHARFERQRHLVHGGDAVGRRDARTEQLQLLDAMDRCAPRRPTARPAGSPARVTRPVGRPFVVALDPGRVEGVGERRARREFTRATCPSVRRITSGSRVTASSSVERRQGRIAPPRLVVSLQRDHTLRRRRAARAAATASSARREPAAATSSLAAASPDARQVHVRVDEAGQDRARRAARRPDRPPAGRRRRRAARAGRRPAPTPPAGGCPRVWTRAARNRVFTTCG